MAKRRSTRSRSRRNKRRGIAWRRLALLSFGVLLLALAAWTLWLDQAVRDQFEGKRWSVPATVYARPLELYQGRPLDAVQLRQELDALDYREMSAAQGSGTWQRQGDSFLLATRAFDFWDGSEPARRVRLSLAGGRVTALRDADSGESVPLVRLDPAPIGHIYPAHREDRLLVRLDEVPETLVGGLLAVEDRNFHGHYGLSPSGILRAAVANVRAGRVVQGGSTVTQQLVKNFYLSSDRSFLRKANEAVMALLLEFHYDKDDILETYLNEVYLAQDRDRSIHGFGLASRFLFGESLDDLSVAQQALLVAMVRGPSFYDPRRNPDRALNRRNLVLAQMENTGVISAAEAGAARGEPLNVLPGRQGPARAYPAFLDLVQRHLRRDYATSDLQSEGLRIFTTMAPAVQAATEAAVKDKLEGMPAPLETAAVMVDVESGEVLALVGGRNPRFAGFNRALDARRPVGSLIKPAVYLAALEQPQRFGLGSVLLDDPLSLQDENRMPWEPRNFDREFRGDVLLVDALAQSWNVPTVRLGMDLGMGTVRRTVDRLGAPLPRRIYPSFLLGTGEMAPLEVAQMYHTLAADGFHTPLRSVREVTRQDGTPLNRYPLAVTRVFDAEPVQLVNAALVSAMRQGTGRSAYYQLPAGLVVAGKTGTTGDGRDSWFAGFGGDLLGVVWMGRDDNVSTGLTGASGALTVWADAMARLRPQPLELSAPQGLETVWIDGVTGLRSAEGCEGARALPYIRGYAPEESVDCAERRRDGRERGGVVEWFRGLFR